MRRAKGRDVRRLSLYVAMAVVVLVMLVPVLYMVSVASGQHNETGLIPSHFALFSNVRSILTNGTFPRFLLNSVILSGSVALIDVCISGIAGYALGALRFPGRTALFVTIIAILGVSPIVVMIPVYTMVRDVGWLNSYQGMIVPLMVSAFGVFLVRQFALGIPRAVINAARLDGATEFRVFRRIALPFLRSALLTLFLLDFLAQWDNLIWPLIVANSSSLWTVPIGLSEYSGEHGVAFGALSAAALVSMVPPFILFLILQRNYVRGLTFGGIDR